MYQLLIPIRLLLASNHQIIKVTIAALRLQIQGINLHLNNKYLIKMIVDKMVCQEQELVGIKVHNNYLILMVLVFLVRIPNPSNNPNNLQLDHNKTISYKLMVAEIAFGLHIMWIILQNMVWDIYSPMVLQVCYSTIQLKSSWTLKASTLNISIELATRISLKSMK